MSAIQEQRQAVHQLLYRTRATQLSLSQQTGHDEKFYDDYNGVVRDYISKEFIEEIPNELIEGHYMPHHPVYK